VSVSGGSRNVEKGEGAEAVETEAACEWGRGAKEGVLARGKAFRKMCAKFG